MSNDFRAQVEEWLAILASPAEVQLEAAQGLPEELRLEWEGRFAPVDERRPDSSAEGLAQFTPAERAALRRFDDFLWSLPPEPDPMWSAAALDGPPWAEVRGRAAAVLGRLGAGASRTVR